MSKTHGDWAEFEDVNDRQAFRDLFNKLEVQKYVREAFGVDLMKNMFLLEPESKYDVDFHVCVDDKIAGIVEVDHLTRWSDSYPYNQDYIHHTIRKMRYINEERYTQYPYLHFTFNMLLDRCYSYGRDAVKKARGPIEKTFSGQPDTVWEVPRSELRLWGNWSSSEKMRFSMEFI